MNLLATNRLTPYFLRIGDYVYIRDRSYRPVRIFSMDEHEISTQTGEIYRYEDLRPVFLSAKTIREFSLPCRGMAIKRKMGNRYLFSVTGPNGGSREFVANSVHLLQHCYHDCTLQPLVLKWKGLV